MKPFYHLVDVVRRGMESPEFLVLPVSSRESLRRGDLAKLIFNSEERMWVTVTDVKGRGRYTGELCNQPVVVTALKLGDVIPFQARHVADIRRTN
jgi:hypothetical protein